MTQQEETGYKLRSSKIVCDVTDLLQPDVIAGRRKFVLPPSPHKNITAVFPEFTKFGPTL